MSIIDNIEIKNFKSIRHQKIEGCKRVNVFIGEPNVGKSNILEALSNFSINSDSDLFTDFVRLGKSTTLFFNGNIEEASEIIINNYYRIKLTYQKYGLAGSFELDRFGKSFLEIDNMIRDADINSISDAKDKVFPLGRFDINEVGLQIKNFEGDASVRFYEGPIPDVAKESRYKKMPVLRYEFKKDVKYESKDAWKLKHPYGQNIFEIISTKPLLNDEIINLFKSYDLNFVYDSGSQEYKILKIVGNKIFTVPYFMIADTLQRLIFYKAAIKTNSNSVLLFEEPEAHMYPPYISKLSADIIFDKNGNQYFIATHSPFVLNDFMEDMDKNNLSIYVVGLKDGETIIRRLTDKQITEVYQYGVDLFFNLEDYLKDAVS
jgi:AAA15 family ATPase/GTPase